MGNEEVYIYYWGEVGGGDGRCSWIVYVKFKLEIIEVKYLFFVGDNGFGNRMWICCILYFICIC